MHNLGFVSFRGGVSGTGNGKRPKVEREIRRIGKMRGRVVTHPGNQGQVELPEQFSVLSLIVSAGDT
jgi:hypothetical protein